MSEKFDPKDFASFDDLPKDKKPEFKPVEGGFVREGVIDDQRQAEVIAHMENIAKDRAAKEIKELPKKVEQRILEEIKKETQNIEESIEIYKGVVGWIMRADPTLISDFAKVEDSYRTIHIETDAEKEMEYSNKKYEFKGYPTAKEAFERIYQLGYERQNCVLVNQERYFLVHNGDIIGEDEQQIQNIRLKPEEFKCFQQAVRDYKLISQK